MTKTTKTYYLVRCGWNAANQSSSGAARNPRDQFQSRQYKLVAVVEAESEEAAKGMFTGTVYNNQSLLATTNPRSIKGLTREAASFASEE